MKKNKLIIAAALVLSMGLAACSGGTDATTTNGGATTPQTEATGDAQNGEEAVKEADPKELVLEAEKNMQALENYGFKMDMVMHMDTKTQGTMDMTMVSDAKMVMKPKMLMQMDSTIDISAGDQNQSMPMTILVEQTDDAIMMYQNVADQWAKTKIGDAADSSMIDELIGNPADNLASYTNNMESATISGEENVDGQDCHKIDLVLTKDALKDVLDSFNGTESLGVDAEAILSDEAALEQIGDLTVTLWVGKDSKTIVKESIDISNIMKLGLQSTLAAQGLAEDELNDIKVTMDITYVNYETAPEITIPEEAKNAPETALY